MASSLKRVENLLKRKTVAWVIYNHPIKCSMKQRDTLTELDLNLYGVASSGDRKLDHDVAETIVDVMLPIREIASKHYEGVNIDIYWGDVALAYELITRHLALWQELVKDHIHPGVYRKHIDEETEYELRILADLAKTIHVHAIDILRTEDAQSKFTVNDQDRVIRGWASQTGQGRALVFRKPTKNAATPEPVGDFPDVNSLLSDIAKTHTLL